MVSKGQFVGLDCNRITRLHSQVMIGTQKVKNSLTASRYHLKAYPRCGQPASKVSILKMKQQHNINLRRTRKKKSESQMGFEPTTLRDLVGCSNHLSYWRLYGEQGPICGSRLEPHHAATQPMIGTQEVKNSLTASRCHLKAYPRCGQPTSKVTN